MPFVLVRSLLVHPIKASYHNLSKINPVSLDGPDLVFLRFACLRIKVKPLESVDCFGIFSQIICVERLDAFHEGWSLDHILEVGIVQTLTSEWDRL